VSRSMYSWYEEAGLLSPACYNSDPVSEAKGFIPSEGVAALVMEPSERIHARPDHRSYAAVNWGRWMAGGQAAKIIRQMLGGSVPSLTICSGNGAPCATSSTAALAREIGGDNPVILPQVFAQGLAGTGALFHLIAALSNRPASGKALFLATARDNGFAALLLELP
jgi:hypothetical protein